MASLIRGLVGVLLVGVLAIAGYLGANQWQSMQYRYERVAGPADCDLRAGPCRHGLGDNVIGFAITPPQIPLMTTLTLEVDMGPEEASAVHVDIRGLNMEMGLNRTQLHPAGSGKWRGEAILPVCSQRRMEWEAAVQIEAQQRVEVPFRFHTDRQ